MANLLFLYTDEQRFDTLAAYGNTKIAMPNLNRLAARSTVFDQTYVTQPVCTPSRSSLVTGLWPTQNGCTTNNIALRPETPCLPELLPEGAYATGHHGKWHLGDEIFAQHGFQEWLATEDTYHAYYHPTRDQAERSAFHHWLIEKGHTPEPKPNLPPEIADRFFRPQIHRLPEEHSRPAFLAETAGNFIRDHKGDPWVLYVNFLEPHMPFHSCRDDQYDTGEIDLPGNYHHEMDDSFDLKARLLAAKYHAHGYEGQRLQTEEDWREISARYWGMCSLVDTAVGRILAALAETDQDEDTIIVFTSDHGDMMASHRLMGKGVQFEESTRVPMLLHVPGQREERHVQGPISHIDVMPTLLDLLGHDAPVNLPGKSLRPLLENPDTPTTDDVFVQWNSPAFGEPCPENPTQPDYAKPIASAEEAHEAHAADKRTIVTPDGLKLNVATNGDHELFDLAADPLETHNLIGDRDQADAVRGLTDRIRRWQESIGDERELPDPV